MDYTHQAPLSLGFSRQEYWGGLPFPSPMHESEKQKWSRSVMSDSLWLYSLPGSSIHGMFQARVLEWVATSFSKWFVESWHFYTCNIKETVSTSKYLRTSVPKMNVFKKKKKLTYWFHQSWCSLVAQIVKIACSAGDPSSIPGQEDPLEKGMASHFSFLTWRIPWTEEPGGLQSMGSQKSQTWLSN